MKTKPSNYICSVPCYDTIDVFVLSSGQCPVPCQYELHPAAAFQGSDFQRWLSQRDLPPHPGAAGSAAAQNLPTRGWLRCNRGPGWQVRVDDTRRENHVRHGRLENHSAAFQPGSHLFRQVHLMKPQRGCLSQFITAVSSDISVVCEKKT